MKIYIAGPITGIKDYKINFEKAAEKIKSKGHEPVNPCLLETILDPRTTSWNEYLLASLGLLRASSAILLLNGWERSRGAQREHREAVALGMKVYKDVDSIRCVIREEVTKNENE